MKKILGIRPKGQDLSGLFLKKFKQKEEVVEILWLSAREGSKAPTLLWKRSVDKRNKKFFFINAFLSRKGSCLKVPSPAFLSKTLHKNIILKQFIFAKKYCSHSNSLYLNIYNELIII